MDGFFEHQNEMKQLAVSSMRETMRVLKEEVKHRKVPMSEFAKVLIFASNTNKQLWEDEMEYNTKRGVKYENRKWCGVPYEEFSIPDLGIY